MKSYQRCSFLSGGIGLFLAFQGCSTSENGQCKKFDKPKYVASSQDTDGKKWEIQLGRESLDFKCDWSGVLDANTKSAPGGTIVFRAVIVDGQGYPKPGLAVQGKTLDSSGAGVRKSETYTDDVATDACGAAEFYVDWTCPAPKKSAGGYFSVSSGPLFSQSVKINIDNSVQPDTVTTTITPSPAK